MYKPPLDSTFSKRQSAGLTQGLKLCVEKNNQWVCCQKRLKSLTRHILGFANISHFCKTIGNCPLSTRIFCRPRSKFSLQSLRLPLDTLSTAHFDTNHNLTASAPETLRATATTATCMQDMMGRNFTGFRGKRSARGLQCCLQPQSYGRVGRHV
jgi:hypothetical protein